jgi:hypothetical protein
MKKFAVWGTIAVLFVFSFAACGKKTGAPVAGSAKADSMLNLLPAGAQGVVVVDVHKAINTDFADKAIKSDKKYEKYQEFIKETGLDPQKDVYFLAVGFAGKTEGGEPDGAVVINMKYDKDLLLAKLRKESPEDVKEETYNGVTLYASPATKTGKKGMVAFLDASNVVGGSDAMVRQVIDVYQKKADNVWKNATLAAVMKGAKTDAMVWSAFAIPPDAMQKFAQQNPMMGVLEGMKAVTTYCDFRDGLSMEIRLAGGDETKNKQLADMLTGFKALGAGAAAKNPDIGDLLNRIEISSGADFVKLNASIPGDLLQRLTKSASEKVKGMIQPKVETPAE